MVVRLRGKILKIDVGSGDQKIALDFLGLDIRRREAVDLLASATHLPFPNNSIDMIYSRRALQHIPQEFESLMEFKRVLKPQGQIEMIVSGYRGWLFYHIVWTILQKKSYPIFRLYTQKSLEKKLKKIGFKNIKMFKTSNPNRKFGFDVGGIAQK